MGSDSTFTQMGYFSKRTMNNLQTYSSAQTSPTKLIITGKGSIHVMMQFAYVNINFRP